MEELNKKADHYMNHYMKHFQLESSEEADKDEKGEMAVKGKKHIFWNRNESIPRILKILQFGLNQCYSYLRASAPPHLMI